MVHAGIYYRPGSLKAGSAPAAVALLEEYAAERGLPYDECGKLVVAVDPRELAGWTRSERTASENGVPGLRRVGPARSPRSSRTPSGWPRCTRR